VNNCGHGYTAGQGIAAAVDAGEVFMQGVTLRGCQDTLYTGPLPPHERLPDGFLGPRQFGERLPSRQHYVDCKIEGTIDFIFGGADALFEDCRILCRDCGREAVGYIAAPSTPKGGLGYLFLHCTVEGASTDSFYLARPWREYGRAIFAECRLDAVIKRAGWDNWGNPANEITCYFAEYKSSGAVAWENRAFGKALSTHEFNLLVSQFRNSVPWGRQQ
ncbi:MAG: pectinesterase family protein, partial [Angelakisella sp.]